MTPKIKRKPALCLYNPKDPIQNVQTKRTKHPIQKTDHDRGPRRAQGHLYEATGELNIRASYRWRALDTVPAPNHDAQIQTANQPVIRQPQQPKQPQSKPLKLAEQAKEQPMQIKWGRNGHIPPKRPRYIILAERAAPYIWTIIICAIALYVLSYS